MYFSGPDRYIHQYGKSSAEQDLSTVSNQMQHLLWIQETMHELLKIVCLFFRLAMRCDRGGKTRQDRVTTHMHTYTHP